MATTYFGTKPVSDWTANGSAESGHNFTEQIANQQSDIDTAKNAYNTQKSNVDTAQKAYEEAYQNQTNYNDLYNQAKESEGVNEAKAQYQKSLEAVNATNTAMNNLPSSINAGSNVVLNSNQRNAALSNQMNRYQNTLSYWTNQNAGDLSQYQTALSSAQSTAERLMSQEQNKVSQALAVYQTGIDYLSNLYNQVATEKSAMQQIYGNMYDDEYNHMQQQIEIWAQNLSAETSRYAEEQANYRTQLQLQAEKEANDISKYLNSGYVWNGSEWVQDNTSSNAAKANIASQLSDVYAQYQAELADLDRQTNDFGSYLFGSNSMLGSGFGTNFTSDRAKNLRSKGFEDYLYNQNPYLQKTLRENYSDLLSAYGLE